MHAAITDLAAQTLDHAKQLIKEMDTSGFVYDRDQMVSLLYMLQEMHTTKKEQETVDHLTVLIDQLERIEHAYHDRVYAQSSDTLVNDMQGLLAGFHQDHVTSRGSVGVLPAFFQGFKKKPGYRSEIVLFALLILLTTRSLYGTASLQIGYVLIWAALTTLLLLCIRWMRTSASGVFATLLLICSTIWLWAMI